MAEALEDTGDEHLARVAYALALYEEPYKSRRASPQSPLLRASGMESVLALAPATVVKDIVSQMKLGEGAVETLRQMGPARFAVTPSGASTVGNAEADLLVGSCLVEVKSTQYPYREAEGAVRQALAYAFLDYADEWGLVRIGIYLSRSGRLVLWDLPSLLSRLADAQVSLPALRASFQSVAMLRV